jgi:hypothetical protein
LPVPAGWVLAGAGNPSTPYVPESLSALRATADLFRAFAGESPMVREAVVRLGDGRQVRLMRLVAREGWLEITCTIWAGKLPA